MKQTKVLLVSAFDSLRGGGQRSILLLARFLDKTFYDVSVLSPKEGALTAALKKYDLKVFVFDLPKICSARSLFVMLSFRSLLKKNNIDIVQVESPREFIYGLVATAFTSKKIIFNARISDTAGFFDRIIYFCASKIIAVSVTASKRFPFPDNNNKIVVVYNSVDIASLPTFASNRKVGKVLLAYFGRLHRRKGVEDLIEAFRSLGQNVELHIWGDGERNYISELKDKAKGLNVKFHGYSADVLPCLEDVDVVVMPARLNEGLSRTVIESMALGKIVIASDVSANIEALGEELSEYSYPAGNSKALKDMLECVIEKKESFEEISCKFKSRAEKNFSAIENTKKYELVYSSLGIDNG